MQRRWLVQSVASVVALPSQLLSTATGGSKHMDEQATNDQAQESILEPLVRALSGRGGEDRLHTQRSISVIGLRKL
jgi:hypothetical protein